MLTVRTFLPIAIVMSAVVGCDSPTADAQAKAERAQREAQQKAAEVATELDKKVTEIDQRAERETDKALREAAEKLNNAAVEAQEKTADAETELAKAREDVRASTSRRIEDLEKDAVELREKAEKKLSKDELGRLMKDVEDKSEAVRKSLRDLDTATSANLDRVKQGIYQRVDELDRAIQAAKRRV